MPKLYWDQQGSPEWYKLRAGIPTSSEFHHIVTPKKMELSASRRKYAARLVCERLLNWQADSLDRIKHIEDGKLNEPFAAAQFQEIYEIETRHLGFATTDDGRFGASPDRVVMKGDNVGLTVEIKAPTLPIQMERLLFGNGEEYRLQVLGHLWVTEADKAVYYSYCPRTPAFHAEFGRDEPAIKKMADCLEQFSDELEALDAKARALGAYQAFESYLTPAEAEYGDRYRPATDAEIQHLIDGPMGEFG